MDKDEVLKDGDKLIRQINRELAWGAWFKLLKETHLPDREYFRELVERLHYSKS